MLVLAYYAIVIPIAYRIGRNGAGLGIAFFFAAVAAQQLISDGPSSFIGGGCQTYGHAARDC